MSHDLSDVLHGFADDQSRAFAADSVDTATRTQTITALVHRRRARHLTGAVAAAVALVVAGTVVANALTPPPPPDPAIPVPSTTPSVTASPTPAPSTAPTSTPAVPGPPEWWVRGWVASLEATPTPRWTVLAGDVVTDWTEDLPPQFSDIVHGDVRLGSRTIDAGDTLITLVADRLQFRQEIVALDSVTGGVRWIKGVTDSRPTYRCAGLSPDGLVACLGSSGPAAAHEIQLLDPATGEIVRAYPTHFGSESLGVAGAVVVVHGTTDSEGTDVRWDGIDLETGEVLWSHLAPGRGEAYEVTGDPVPPTTFVSWPYARLDGYFYGVSIDVRTGAEISGPAGSALDVNLDVWAPTDPEAVPVFDPWARGAGGTILFDEPSPLRALDPTDGSVLWSLDTTGAMPAAVVGDVLVVSDDPGTSAVDVVTGQLLWTVPVHGSVMATDGARILLDDGTVLSIDDGSVLVPGPARAGAVPLGRSGRLVAIGRVDTVEVVETLTLLGW